MPSLVINIIGDASSLQRALRKAERESRTFSQKMGTRLKFAGVAAGSALASGLVIGLKRSVDAAMNAQKVLGQTQVAVRNRSEEHTSELQSLRHLVCRLL